MTSVYEPYRITATTGITNEIFLAACHAAGLPIASVEILPPERARLIFENDPNAIYIDADSYVSTAKNPSYAIVKQWPFSVSIYYDKSQFGADVPKTIKDFAGKRMGYFRADIGTKNYFSAQGAIMSPSDLQSQLFVMLVHHRIDMLVSVEDTAKMEFERADADWHAHIGIFGPFYSGFGGPIYHVDSTAATEFVAAYVKGYRQIQTDGTMLAILEHYYGKGRAPDSFFK